MRAFNIHQAAVINYGTGEWPFFFVVLQVKLQGRWTMKGGRAMNRGTIFLAIMSTVLAAACNDDQGSQPVQPYTVTIEDHETTPYQFSSGAYYSFVFPEPESFEFDVDAVFREAAVRGVQLRDAWYKNYSPACTPPGSTISMPAIVPGGFVVRVDERARVLQAIGFVETSDPSLEWCAYRVRHYHFTR